MRLALVRHEDSQGQAAAGVEVDLAWAKPGILRLAYTVTGDVSGLLLPAPAPAERTDELWRHTCLEAFVGEADGPTYYEVNLAPSTCWAAYRFSGYREGMAPALGIGDPGVSTRIEPDRFTLTATLALSGADGLRADADWRLALSAVIEQTDGRKSYWALTHPPGRADFHHALGFSHRITASERA